LVMSADDLEVLRDVAGDELHYQLARDLLDVERRFQSMARRAGLFDEMEKVFRRSFYDDKDDAISRARRLADLKSGLVVVAESMDEEDEPS
jgi:DNA sulfur modification protein DndC